MSFAREDELHRPFRIVHHHCELLKLFQDQVGALVCSKAACKANRQCVRTQRATKPLDVDGWLFPTFRLFGRAAANKVQKTSLQTQMSFPKFPVIDILDAFPQTRFATSGLPPRTEMSIVEF